MRRKRNGQSTLEYAVLIALVVGGLLAMQIYMKRGSMGKLKAAADDLGSQFQPDQSSWNITSKVTTSRTQTTVEDGSSGEAVNSDLRTRRGSEKVEQDLAKETLFTATANP